MIADRLIDAFTRAPLNGAQWRIVWYVIRRTYGWQRPTEVLSVREIADATELNRSTVASELRDLVRRGYLLSDGDNSHAKRYGVQADPNLWEADEKGVPIGTPPTPLHPPKGVPIGNKGCADRQQGVCRSAHPTIGRVKETLKTEKENNAEPDGSGTLRDRFESEYRNAKNKNGIVGKYFQLLLGQKPDVGRLGGMKKRLNSGGRLFDVMLAISKQHITDDAHDYLEKAVQRELRGEGSSLPADDGVPLSKRMSGNVRRLQGADW